MRAWIIAGIMIICILFFGLFYYIYVTTSDPLSARENEAVNIARKETNLAAVKNIDFYHGSRSYQVIEGSDDAGKGVYVWVEELKEEQKEENVTARIVMKFKHEGITKEEVREIVDSELEMKELISIRLGMIGVTPIYEVTYIDEDDRHSFYYLSFEDGSYINRHYQL